jgi:hypothetical protein
MWNFLKSKEEIESWKMLKNYFDGDGMEKLAKLQAKYSQEEHFKQLMIKQKQECKTNYEFFQARIDNNETLSEQEMKDYRYFKFISTGSL